VRGGAFGGNVHVTSMTFILDQERSARFKGTGIFATPEKVVYKVYFHTNSRLHRHTRAFWWLGAVSGQIVVSRAPPKQI
jgi:hypothetical protein